MRRPTILLVLLFAGLGVFSRAQEHAAPAKPAGTAENPTAPAHAGGPEVEHAKPEAGGHEGKEAGGEDVEEAMKQSASVKWLGEKLGITDPRTAYWVFVAINFLVVAGFIGMLLKAKLPAAFRDRRATIQKRLEEARAASADASARLAEIESRLGRMDTEVAALRASAAEQSRAEAERFRASTEEERKKVVAAAEQEIAAAAGNARRELKHFAAELAVALAEKKIVVDETTDRALVRDFTRSVDGSN